MTAARVERLRASLDEPLLVTGASNLRYLTGFASSNAAALVEPDRVRLFADARYSEAGRAVPDVEFIQTGRILLADLAKRLEGRIAFEEEHVSYAGFRALSGGSLELVPVSGMVEALRAVKGEDEIVSIARASAVADATFTALLSETWIDRTESELAWRLRVLAREHGAEDLAFDAIVGSGPNGARPHAQPGDRAVREGDLVVVDFGCLVDGYRSDCARTVMVADVDPRLSEIVDICIAAHQTAISTIVPGMTGVEADAVARTVIADAGYGDHFGHALGHGIGLDVHEAPTLSAISNSVLEVGNVVTIEPGIYLPDLGGVRVEDLCVVREDGLESHTTLPNRIEL